jgi:sec-independent protein translocase protein TatB
MFDFGVGYSEMLVLAIVAVIVIGPKDLPKVLRTFGQFMNKARAMSREFQGHVDAAMKDAGVDGLKKDMMDVRKAVSGAASTPTGAAPPSIAPKFPTNNPYMQSTAVREFETQFGNTGSTGETRIAGALHVEPEATT